MSLFAGTMTTIICLCNYQNVFMSGKQCSLDLDLLFIDHLSMQLLYSLLGFPCTSRNMTSKFDLTNGYKVYQSVLHGSFDQNLKFVDHR